MLFTGRHDGDRVLGLAQATGSAIILENIKLGKPTLNKSLPLKLVFRLTSEASSALTELVKAKQKNCVSKFSNVIGTRDRTNRDRQYLISLRVELDGRAERS